MERTEAAVGSMSPLASGKSNCGKGKQQFYCCTRGWQSNFKATGGTICYNFTEKIYMVGKTLCKFADLIHKNSKTHLLFQPILAQVLFRCCRTVWLHKFVADENVKFGAVRIHSGPNSLSKTKCNKTFFLKRHNNYNLYSVTILLSLQEPS